MGYIGLAGNNEVSVPEIGGLYSTLRVDTLAVPAAMPSALKVETDERLYSVTPVPTDLADYAPFTAATLQQSWILCGGRRDGDYSSSAIYSPEPIVLTKTLIAEKCAENVQETVLVPAHFTWINQERLISAQQ